MWNPNPSNSVIFRSGTYAFLFDDDPDFPGWQVMVLLSRQSTSGEWLSFASILTGAWTDAVTRAGGWLPWITATMDRVNTEVHKQLGDPSPIPPVTIPPGAPQTFPECKAWLLQWLYFTDTATTSNGFLGDKPKPPEVYSANEVFNVGKQRIAVHLEFNDTESSISFQRWIPPDSWVPVKVK